MRDQISPYVEQPILSEKHWRLACLQTLKFHPGHNSDIKEPKTKSRAEKKSCQKKSRAEKKSCQKKSRAEKTLCQKKVVPEKTDVVKKKLDDKN